jgi:hypothetical protein
MAKMSERKEAFFRIIVAIVSGIILGVWNLLIRVLIVLNFLYTIFKNKRHKGMADLCEWWNTEAYKFMRYLTFVSNVRPFPFSNVERMSKFA